MKQGNPTKRFGLLALISAMLGGLISRPQGVTDQELHQRKTFVLMNGGRAPIPNRMKNQRQKRKSQRQTNTH